MFFNWENSSETQAEQEKGHSRPVHSCRALKEFGYGFPGPPFRSAYASWQIMVSENFRPDVSSYNPVLPWQSRYHVSFPKSALERDRVAARPNDSGQHSPMSPRSSSKVPHRYDRRSQWHRGEPDSWTVYPAKRTTAKCGTRTRKRLPPKPVPLLVFPEYIEMRVALEPRRSLYSAK